MLVMYIPSINSSNSFGLAIAGKQSFFIMFCLFYLIFFFNPSVIFESVKDKNLECVQSSKGFILSTSSEMILNM